MHNTKRYFLHHLKSVLPRLAVFTVISVLITVMTANGSHSKYAPEHSDVAFYILSVIIGFLAAVIPMFEFSLYNSKRNLDTLFSLPISRSSLALVHIAVGFIQMFLVFTVSTAALFASHLDFAEFYDLYYIIPYYFSVLGLGTAVYFIFTFIFTQANTTLDGIVFCGFWTFNLYLVFFFLDRLFDLKYFYDMTAIYAPINGVTSHFQYRAEMINREEIFARSDAIFITLWCVLGALAFLGTVLMFRRKKVERVGEVSDSIFGYTLNIPLYFVCLTSLFNDVTATVWLAICAVVGYFIFRRGFRLKKADLISIIISFILLCVCNVLKALI